MGHNCNCLAELRNCHFVIGGGSTISIPQCGHLVHHSWWGGGGQTSPPAPVAPATTPSPPPPVVPSCEKEPCGLGPESAGPLTVSGEGVGGEGPRPSVVKACALGKRLQSTPKDQEGRCRIPCPGPPPGQPEEKRVTALG